MINSKARQMKLCGGYDHNFVLRGRGLRRAARLEAPGSGLVMEVFTDRPGMQFYTANALAGVRGKRGKRYGAEAPAALKRSCIRTVCITIISIVYPWKERNLPVNNRVSFFYKVEDAKTAIPAMNRYGCLCSGLFNILLDNVCRNIVRDLLLFFGFRKAAEAFCQLLAAEYAPFQCIGDGSHKVRIHCV